MTLRSHLPCKIYPSYKDRNGYGYKSQTSKGERLVHRQVFLETYGYLPPVVRHLCNNPSCVEPTHLAGGTQADNMMDMAKSGTRKGITGVKGETHGRHKLTEQQVLEIRGTYVKGKRKMTYQMLADKYNVSKRTIKAAVNRELWRHI